MIKGVAFDLEGTLIDIEWAHQKAHLKAAQEAGVFMSRVEAIAKLPHLIGGPDELVAWEIYALSNQNRSISEIVAYKEFYFDSMLAEIREIMPRPRVVETLIWLKEHGYPIAIGSVTASFRGMTLIQRSGLDKFFEKSKMIFRENVANPKPFPDVYIETASRLGIPSKKQLVFEDSVSGVEAGVSAGSLVIAVPTINSSELTTHLDRAGARAVLTNWNAVNIESLVLLDC